MKLLKFSLCGYFAKEIIKNKKANASPFKIAKADMLQMYLHIYMHIK